MIFSTTSKFFVLKSTVLYYTVRVSVGVVPMAIFLRHKKESQLHARGETQCAGDLMGTESSKCAMHKKGHQANNCQQDF